MIVVIATDLLLGWLAGSREQFPSDPTAPAWPSLASRGDVSCQSLSWLYMTVIIVFELTSPRWRELDLKKQQHLCNFNVKSLERKNFDPLVSTISQGARSFAGSWPCKHRSLSRGINQVGLLCATPELSHLFHTTTYGAGFIMIPIFQIKKLRYRESK